VEGSETAVVDGGDGLSNQKALFCSKTDLYWRLFWLFVDIFVLANILATKRTQEKAFSFALGSELLKTARARRW